LITFCRLTVTYLIDFISSAIHLQGRSAQAQIAQTHTSTGTPRQGFHSAAWHATRLSRDVLSRGVKLPKEVLLLREVSLPREVMQPREVSLTREVMRPREVLESKHEEPSYLA